MKKIETKITKNGKLTVKIDGKRAKLQDAIDAVFESDIDNNVIVIKNHLGNIFTGGFSFENRYMNFVFNHTFSSNPDKVTGTYAFNMSEVAIEKIANHQFAEYKISEPIAEANPDDYAVSQEAMDVAVDAETELANKASKAAKKNYSINPVIGEDDNMKLNHVDIYTKGNKVEISGCFECKNIETAYRRFRKIMIQIDADHPELQLGGENDWLPANKITLVSTGEKYEEHFCGYNENGDMIFSASPVEALAVDINEDWFYFYGKFTIENIKEETQMTNTIEVANEGNATITIGDDTVTFVNGKFHSVFSAKYHMAIIRDLVGCYSYCIFGDDDTEVYNVREHETSYDNFMETLYQRGNREKLLALRKDYIITDHLSENNSHMWYVNGKRSGQVKVYNLLQSYGLTIAEFLAEDEAYINERIAASAAKIAIEDQAKFLKDKIARDAQPCDDNDDVFNLIPNVSELNDVEIVETSPANTLVADIEEDDVEELNPIVETKITKRSLDSVSLKLNGKRISLRNLEDALDAPRTNFAVINEYGKKYDCRRCSKDYYGFFGTSPEEYTIHFNTLGELVKHYAFDDIVRDTASETPVDSKLTADIAKYQAAFEKARQISIRAGSGVCKINGEEIWFNYGNLRSISSDNYRAEITFNNGRKRFRYRGMITKRTDFLDRMSNEIVAAEQKEIFGKFYDTYQMPDTELDPNADYFQIRIFPKFANGTESSFHATANDFDRALELINQFKSLNLPFIGLIKRNTVCGEEYYRHNRDGSETVNPPEPPKPTDKEPYRPFTVKDTIESLNHSINWAKGILATMQGDTYSDDWQDWTRPELETAIIDWQDELGGFKTKPAEHTADSIMPALEIANNFIKDQKLTLDVNTDNFISYAGDDLRLNIFLENGNHTAVSVTSDEQPIAIIRIDNKQTRKQKKKALKEELETHKRNIRIARSLRDNEKANHERELYLDCQRRLEELKKEVA